MPAGAIVMIAGWIVFRVSFVRRMRVGMRVHVAIVAVGMNVMLGPVLMRLVGVTKRVQRAHPCQASDGKNDCNRLRHYLDDTGKPHPCQTASSSSLIPAHRPAGVLPQNYAARLVPGQLNTTSWIFEAATRRPGP
jgi:hypothetical protein